MKQFLAGGLLALALSGTAMAGPLEDADAAYQRRDYAMELQILRPLADQGNAAAQTKLGWVYYFGYGVPEDLAQAHAWWRKAAEQGDAEAQDLLGDMYRSGGVGAPQDYAQAVSWYRKAAEQGDAIAQRDLGEMYHDGQGVPQDYIRAHMWFNLAASGTSPPWFEFQDHVAKNRDEVAAKMSPAQIAEAQRMAREWKPTK